MSTLVFHSINELQDYLNTAPEDESIRVSVVVENNDGESCNDGEEKQRWRSIVTVSRSRCMTIS